jgi:glycosyltransferase involved in cell wall biosynthesis
MKIIHFPSWYPTKENTIEGIFNQRLIYAINNFDTNEHIVFTWHHNEIAKLKNPILFFLQLFKSFMPYKVHDINGVKVIKINYLITNEFFFGKNVDRLIRKLDSTLRSLSLYNSAIIFHAHITYPGAFIAQQLSLRQNIPYLITEHMGPFPFDNLKNDQLSKVIRPMKDASEVVSVSSFLAKQVQELVGIKTHVIPNVVCNISFKLPSNKIYSSGFKFIVVSRITYAKGIEVLIVAIEKLLKIRRDFCVDIYGEGEMKDYFMKLTLSKKLVKQINWLDSIYPDLVQHTISNYNCLISPSLYESFGVTLIEAISVGIPIIATDCGGPKDIVNDINGLLTPNNNPIELAFAMNTLINTYHQYSKDIIIEDCNNRFSDKIIAQKYNLIYNRIYNTKSCAE